MPAQIETTWSSTGYGAYCGLLEQLDHPLAAGELGLGGVVEVRGEGREGLEVAVLGQVHAERAGDLASSP